MKHFTTRAEQEAAEYNARLAAAAKVNPETLERGCPTTKPLGTGNAGNQLPVAPSGNAGGEHEEHPRSSTL